MYLSEPKAQCVPRLRSGTKTGGHLVLRLNKALPPLNIHSLLPLAATSLRLLVTVSPHQGCRETVGKSFPDPLGKNSSLPTSGEWKLLRRAGGVGRKFAFEDLTQSL